MVDKKRKAHGKFKRNSPNSGLDRLLGWHDVVNPGGNGCVLS
jgi:hypothetical protein